jgi:ATP-dependent DNA helicase RecG
MQAIMEKAEWKDRTIFRNKFINLFLEMELIQMTIPEKPNSSKQKYETTEKGIKFINLIKNRSE